jgi:uncharacterized membrane protein
MHLYTVLFYNGTGVIYYVVAGDMAEAHEKADAARMAENLSEGREKVVRIADVFYSTPDVFRV